MKDTDLYSQILGLAAPWFVDAVKLNTVEGRVDIHVEHSSGVRRVRKQEHRELMGQEDHRLRGTKYLWLYREENLPDKHRPTLEVLKASNLKVAKAWAMKERLNDVWKYLSMGWAGASLSDG